MTFDWTIKITDLAIIFAAVAGPILAVQAQNGLKEEARVKHGNPLSFGP